MFRAYCVLNTQVLTIHTLHNQKRGILMEQTLGETIFSCIRCCDWFTGDNYHRLTYEEKLHLQASSGYDWRKKVGILCEKCHAYCARRYRPYIGRMLGLHETELYCLYRELQRYPDAGDASVLVLGAGLNGHIILGTKLEQENFATKESEMREMNTENHLRDLVLRWLKKGSGDLEDFLTQDGKMQPEEIAGMNGELDVAIEVARIQFLVQEWHEGPAYEHVHLADFCEQHDIPISGRDELSPAVKSALGRVTRIM